MRHDADSLHTGIEYRKDKVKFTPAIIFDDDTCPMCGEKMERIVIQSFDIPSTVRFECKNCWFYAPIRHSTENLAIPLPLYDNLIAEFIEGFGENVHDRIEKTLEKKFDLIRD